jgi:hypothetical protein
MGILLAVNRGVLDEVPVEGAEEAVGAVQDRIGQVAPEICGRMEEGDEVEEDELEVLVEEARRAVESLGLRGEED